MDDQYANVGPIGGDSSLFTAICVEFALVVFVSVVVVVARLIAKRSISNYSIEDYFSVAPWICVNGFAATLLVAATKGFGEHMWNIDSDKVSIIAKISWVLQQVYCISMWIAKAGLLFQLQPTFDVSKKSTIFIASQLLVWGNLAFYLSCWIVLLAECQPMATIWDSSIKDYHCIDRGVFLIAMSAINIISDVVMFILPVWTAWRLRVSLTKLYGVAVLLAVAILAVLCSIGRLVAVIAAWHNTDGTYTFARVAMWSLAEITCILTCTCLPLMPQSYRVITGKSTVHTSNHSDSFQDPKPTPDPRPHSFAGRCKDCINDILCQFHGNESSSMSGIGHTRKSRSKKMRLPSAISEDDTLNRHETASSEAVGRRSSLDGLSFSDNPLSSNGIIVRREFQVRRGVDAESLGIDPRSSIRGSPYDGSRVVL